MAGTVVVPLIGLAALASVLLPWVRTGRTDRSGFGLARAAEDAGLVQAIWLRDLLGAVYALPALAALVCAASLVGRLRAARVLAGALGVVVTVASLAVLVELGSGLEAGPFVGAGLGLTTIAASAAAPRRLAPSPKVENAHAR